jgi:hypothetical protein
LRNKETLVNIIELIGVSQDLECCEEIRAKIDLSVVYGLDIGYYQFELLYSILRVCSSCLLADVLDNNLLGISK